jgi:hypothetical protein
MQRLMAATGLVALAASLLLNWLGVPPYLLFAGIPYLALTAGYLMQPIERRVNHFFFSDAQKRLAARPELIRIGITGSYGKTSTKFILAAILSEKYSVLTTPSSFNTPMGLTKVIRAQLEPHHQVFIAEMGARHVGDIRELCELVHPNFGVLTSVGAQHLETFGTVETVAKTKFELIEGLAPGGAAFLRRGRRRLVRQALCLRQGRKVPRRAGLRLPFDVRGGHRVRPLWQPLYAVGRRRQPRALRNEAAGPAQHPEHRAVRRCGKAPGHDHGGDRPGRAPGAARGAQAAADGGRRRHDHHRRCLQRQPRRCGGGLRGALRVFPEGIWW